MNKYKAKKTIVDGITFDSKAEASYYMVLKDLRKNSEIAGFDMQVKYPLTVNGKLVCTYVSDFNINHNDGSVEVVDVKGIKTRLFILKSKLFSAIYGKEISIIKMGSDGHPYREAKVKRPPVRKIGVKRTKLNK